MIDALKDINEHMGKTIIMVTHDPQMASYCSRLILLKVVCIGRFGKNRNKNILSGDSWKDERVVENSPDSQKFSISKLAH